MPFARSQDRFQTTKSRPSAERSLQRRTRYLLITITLLCARHHHVAAQQITTQAPPALPPAPGQADYPVAHLETPILAGDTVVIETAGPQTYQAGVYTLDRDVVITYRDRRVQADHIDYDANTGDLTVTGHVLITARANTEIIHASHGVYNLRSATGRFFDVTGSVGILPKAPSRGPARKPIYTSGNPFLFSGRILVKSGERDYDLYDGTLTSCQLPHPDWLLSSGRFTIAGDKASARASTFRLLNVPLLFLPYVTHPIDADQRETGILIPTVGQSTTRGLTLGEQFYLTLGRSSDLTVGAEYYSSIGYAQNATYRLRGPGLDFLTLHYAGVVDQRLPATNQGGEEVVLAARFDLGPNTRAATNIDYLSSYVYREAFTDIFNQAVTSDILSTAYLTRTYNGFESAGLFDRYQGIKLVAQGNAAQQQVHLFHAPTLSFATTDHRLGTTGLQLSLDSSASGLKRSQPNFTTSGVVERFDIHPEIAYPIALGPWHLLPTVAARETVYTRSRLPPAPGRPLTEDLAPLSRSAFEFTFGVRPPVLARDFKLTRFQRVLGSELRHTVAPELTYRLTSGISNFANILRFDAIDVASNTNEAEYGVTQRLFRRPLKSRDPSKPCASAEIALAPGFNSQAAPSDTQPASPTGSPFEADTPVAGCPAEDLISWRLTQKYFFDQLFGGAIQNGRRNIFTTTLGLSGVSFLTEPRAISPLISRLRVRTSAHTDVEWDFDLDTGARKFTSSNVFIDVHQGNGFAALSYARLDAPGRFFTQSPDPGTGANSVTGVTSQVSDFNQLRTLLGYGNPVKPGLSVASNLGIDLKSLYGATSQNTNARGVVTTTTVYPALLQYAAVQTSYNWNCCGLAIEYRKFELGSVRNEGSYKFNFTLANIGAAGNLRRAERLF